MLGLPYEAVYAVDFEFQHSGSAALPSVHCMVVRELVTGAQHELWLGDGAPGECPFRTDERALWIAHNAVAEASCFLALGWSMPARWFDTMVEHRCTTNVNPGPFGHQPGYSLIDALEHHGIPHIELTRKDEMRALAIRGGPFTPQERADLIAYCATDVEPLAPLFERQVVHLGGYGQRFKWALNRARYMVATARMSAAGIPVDTDTLSALYAGWDTIKPRVIAESGYAELFGEGALLRGPFAGWIADQGIAGWPATPMGSVKTDADTFSEMVTAYPQIEPIAALVKTLSSLHSRVIPVSDDGRSRPYLWPYAASTGRNQPKAKEFVFLSAKWLRGLIRPPEGYAVAYIDWKSQEIAVAGALSGDAALLDAVSSGDPYMAFAIRAGMAPPGATKATHPDVRARTKVVLLASNYGQSAGSLSVALGCSRSEAAEVLRSLRRAYPRFSGWRDDRAERARIRLADETLCGWRVRYGFGTKPNAMLNFPVQANGAELLRLAVSLATERGVEVCCPVHDAVLILAKADEIEHEVERMRSAMDEASRVLLGGYVIGTDVEVYKWPDRYMAEGAQDRWNRVMSYLNR